MAFGMFLRLVRTINVGFLIVVFFATFISFAQITHASTISGTVNSTNKYAWSNVGGWTNFSPTHSTVSVTDSKLSGYAWSENDGWINLNPAKGGVKNDGTGTLSGQAWDGRAGWINFSGVTIDSSGKFHGKATGGAVNGVDYYINFNCTNCDVETDWRPVSVRAVASIAGGFVPVSNTGNSTNPLPGGNISQSVNAKSSTNVKQPATLIATLSAKVNKLVFVLQTLQKELATVQSTPNNGHIASPHQYSSSKFPRSLHLYMVGNDVLILQKYLNTHGAPVAVSGAGSIGYETRYFGTLTQKALAIFQQTNADKILTPLHLTVGTGYFGDSTRAYILAHL